MSIWSRIYRAWSNAKPEYRQEMEGKRRLNLAHNRTVRTRQVLRRQAFKDAVEIVNEDYGGEPRARRRRIARARAHREWRAPRAQ